MPKKLLCIACSEDRIVLCQFSMDWRSTKLLGHTSISLNNASEPRTVAKELAAIIDRNDLHSDEYKISLSSSLAVIRNWTFPFSSKKQISQALDFELEQEIPFSPLEGVTDIQFGVKTTHGRNVTSATLHKEYLSAFLEELLLHEINPQLVTLDAFSLANIASKMENSAPTLLLDIGMHHTLLVYIDEGTPYAISQIPHGLTNIKKALQQQFNSTEDEVERQLFFLNLASDSADAFQQSLIQHLQQLAKQITLSANATGAKANTILLCGDLATIQGSEGFFSDELATPVTALHKHPKTTELIPIEDKNDWIECIPALGLAESSQLALSNQQIVNFRKDEFSFHKKTDPLTSTLKYATVIACTLMLAWAGSLTAQGYQKAQEAKTLNRSLKQTLQKTLPDVKGSFGTIQYTSILKSRLAQLEGRNASNQSQPAVDSLDLLQALHQSTPNSLDVAIENIRISEKNIDLVGTTNSYNTLEKVRSQLSQNSYFKAVTIRGATNQKKQSRIRFELEIEKAG